MRERKQRQKTHATCCSWGHYNELNHSLLFYIFHCAASKCMYIILLLVGWLLLLLWWGWRLSMPIIGLFLFCILFFPVLRLCYYSSRHLVLQCLFISRPSAPDHIFPINHSVRAHLTAKNDKLIALIRISHEFFSNQNTFIPRPRIPVRAKWANFSIYSSFTWTFLVLSLRPL